MPTIQASGNGDITDAANWGGTLPGDGDVADINGHTMTFDASGAGGGVWPAFGGLTELKDTAGGGTIAVDMTQGDVTLSVDTITGNDEVLFTLTGAAPSNTFTVNIGTVITGGSGAADRAIYHNSTAAVAITDGGGGTLVITGGSNGTAQAIFNNSSGNITITCDHLIGGTAAALYNGSTGAIVVNGTSKGGSTTGSHGIQNNSTGTVTINNGDIQGGTGNSAHGVLNSGSATCTLNNGNLIDSAGATGSCAYRGKSLVWNMTNQNFYQLADGTKMKKAMRRTAAA